MRAGWAATWVLAFSGWLVTPREVVTHSGTHPDESLRYTEGLVVTLCLAVSVHIRNSNSASR